MSKTKILLVEDEAHLLYYLRLNLEQEGYEIISATNGIMGLDRFHQDGPFALIVMDINMPKLNGFEVAKQIRQKDPHVGILLLTARASHQDRLYGLKLGVDDYVTKPFQLEELLLRIKRMAQRSIILSHKKINQVNDELTLGPFKLLSNQLTLKKENQSFQLTELEAKLLEQFFTNPNVILTRSMLLENVWGFGKQYETRTIDNFVARLRKIIEEDPSKPKLLSSVRGKGYRLNI